jgi:peptidoglycan hydrolase CwlO-like protein
MNRSVLVIICDFLLISLLSLANFDRTTGEDVGPAGATAVEVQAVQDMLEVLQQALAQEQDTRGTLSNQLATTQEDLDARQQELAERNRQIQEAERSLRDSEARLRLLAEERARLQQAQEQAQQQVARLETQQQLAETNILTLQEQLQAATSEATVSKATADAIRAELAARRDEVRQLQSQIGGLQQTAFAAQEEKGRLATNLTRVQTEALMFRTQLEQTQEQVASVVEEKQRLQEHATALAKGIDSVAQESQTLAAEIREHRELAPNAIYQAYLDHRLQSSSRATRSGFLGIRAGDSTEASVVLFRDRDQVFVLYHITDTSLPLWGGGGDWQEMTVVLVRGGQSVNLDSLTFVSSDPRLLVATLDAATVARLGVEPFEVSEDPSKFQDAVVVGGKDGYYGEVEFRLVPGLPRYLKMNRRPLGKIFGKFSPSKGDLAYSKSGELLGMMVNSQYCALARSLPPARVVPLGKEIAKHRTSLIGAEVSRRLQALPLSLQ